MMSHDSPSAQGAGTGTAPGSSRPLRADAQRNRDRILDAAEQVFAEHGRSASTEEVAARAGVAIGTVFRHFPTKDELLRAIMKRLLGRVTAEIVALARGGDPGTALFEVFTRLVDEAAEKKSVVDLLDVGPAGDGVEHPAGGQVLGALELFTAAVGELVRQGQRAGAVDPAVAPAAVMALLTSTCQGALRGGWDSDLRRRTLAIIFAGLRTHAAERDTR
ncbi:TetR/AcrR family transcriptional regulator [Plantactinospora siamensis]|uniref:TetR/AcrR family transcriptional regulator n=1 Tax=Plantactinospora siamensis TaxID=555372 RepID=A0ABV6NZH7_9ACTN